MQKHITIIATEFGVENHGLENRTAVYEFLVDSAMTSDDVLEAIKKASTEYCQTENGKRTYIGNCNNFNIGDFDMCSGTEDMKRICKKYGLYSVEHTSETITMDFNMELVNEYDIFPEEE